MPIFHVDLASAEAPPSSLAKSLADPLGELMGAEPGHVWVRVTHCPPALYAENDVAAPPAWVFVRIILRALPTEDELAKRAQAITRLIAEHTRRAIDDVHLVFEPSAAGRIAFGGELVRS